MRGQVLTSDISESLHLSCDAAFVYQRQILVTVLLTVTTVIFVSLVGCLLLRNRRLLVGTSGCIYWRSNHHEGGDYQTLFSATETSVHITTPGGSCGGVGETAQQMTSTGTGSTSDRVPDLDWDDDMSANSATHVEDINLPLIGRDQNSRSSDQRGAVEKSKTRAAKCLK